RGEKACRIRPTRKVIHMVEPASLTALIRPVFSGPIRHGWRRVWRTARIEVVSDAGQQFCRTRSEWSRDSHTLVTRRRLGLKNRTFSPIKVKVVVERVEEEFLDRALQVSDTPEGTDELTVPPKGEPTVFVGFIDQTDGFAWVEVGRL